MLTFNWEKAWIILSLPTLRSVQFYAIKVIEKRFAVTYILYANGHFQFPCFFLGHLVSLWHICVSPRDRAEDYFYFCTNQGNWNEEKEYFPIRREKKKKAEQSFILTGKGRLKLTLLRTRKLMTPFLFEVHWPKYQNEQTLWWQSLTHSCPNLNRNKPLQIYLMLTDDTSVYQLK